MSLAELLTPARVKVPIEAREKGAVLRELVGLLAAHGDGEFLEVIRAVEEREALMSTGIGHGVAIPHGKSGSIHDLLLAAGASPEPIPFDALDGQPVRLFFLLVGPERAAAQHIKALSRISRLTRQASFRERLLSARDGKEFYEFLCEADDK